MATAWISITPLFTVYMLFMDHVFVLNTTLLAPIAFLLRKCCNAEFLTAMTDRSYEVLFQMKPHEVNGFRRMRTITQAIFETLIQLAVQIHMLIFVTQFVED